MGEKTDKNGWKKNKHFWYKNPNIGVKKKLFLV